MNKLRTLPFLTALALATLVRASAGPEVAQKLYDQVTPSLVAVQFTWESELGRRDLVGAGIIITSDGVVAAPLSILNPAIPDAQMKDFKVIVPRTDANDEELDATFLGRDERSGLGFVKIKDKRDWKPIKFEDAPVNIGQPVYSIGILPKGAGYRSYFMEGAVSAKLRGEVHMVLVTNGGLCGLGSPVFNTSGQAIGVVYDEQVSFLNDPRQAFTSIQNPPLFFMPAKEFIRSFSDLPVAGEPQKLPWIGVMQLTGLKKDVAEFFGLKDQPAVQIGDVIPDAPAAKAGLKRGDVIVKVDGKPLERGDDPDELPGILRHQLIWFKPGQSVTLSVTSGKGQPLHDVKLTMAEQPARATSAKRFYAEDLGFSVRDLTFQDRYQLKLDDKAPGVLVAIIRPSSSSQTAHLEREDLILQLNGQPVTDVDEFKKAYEQLRKDKPHEPLVMEVKRAGSTQVIRIEPPQ
ncbi:MAG TPA: PDZ domain-containing protein [Tepidisphaeraceae bacterium]|jgi:serine protease Do|nr:PDZ domain-containing protein [Tepidisphaeraceae bacterium]